MTEIAENVKLNPGFSQVVVWPSMIVGADSVKEFEDFITEQFGVRAQYLEEIETYPDSTGPGGRNDVFFAVHDDDVGKFAIPRLAFGMRWIEDVFGNDHGGLYPARVAAYQSWNDGE